VLEVGVGLLEATNPSNIEGDAKGNTLGNTPPGEITIVQNVSESVRGKRLKRAQGHGPCNQSVQKAEREWGPVGPKVILRLEHLRITPSRITPNLGIPGDSYAGRQQAPHIRNSESEVVDIILSDCTVSLHSVVT
jgi:hypothetical protein